MDTPVGNPTAMALSSFAACMSDMLSPTINVSLAVAPKAANAALRCSGCGLV